MGDVISRNESRGVCRGTLNFIQIGVFTAFVIKNEYWNEG